MIEKQILQALTFDEEYTRQVLPFLKEDYFVQTEHTLVFKVINEYFDKYNSLPKREALVIDISQRGGVDEKTIQAATELVETSSRKSAANINTFVCIS